MLINELDFKMDLSRLHRDHAEEVRELATAWKIKKAGLQARIDALEREINGETDKQEESGTA